MINITIAIDDNHPETGWGVEGDKSMEYLDELNKEFGAKFTLFIPSNYHHKYPISQYKDWIDYLLGKKYFELVAHGHFHQTSNPTQLGEMEFMDMSESECVDRVKSIINEWETVNHKPKGWRNPGWMCQPYCIQHLEKEFKWVALHYQHNHNFQWNTKMLFGADGIHETDIKLHNGNNIMFQSHIAGDWNHNIWNEKNYEQVRLSLKYLIENHDVTFKTISEII